MARDVIVQRYVYVVSRKIHSLQVGSDGFDEKMQALGDLIAADTNFVMDVPVPNNLDVSAVQAEASTDQEVPKMRFVPRSPWRLAPKLPRMMRTPQIDAQVPLQNSFEIFSEADNDSVSAEAEEADVFSSADEGVSQHSAAQVKVKAKIPEGQDFFEIIIDEVSNVATEVTEFSDGACTEYVSVEAEAEVQECYEEVADAAS